MTSFPGTPSDPVNAVQDLTAATLPTRPLKLSSGTIAGPRGLVFLLLILLGLGGFMLWWQLPGLIRDWRINQNPIVVFDSDVQDGHCTTRKAIFTDCEARLVYAYNGTDYASDVQLMFVDIHSGDYSVDVVISGDKPELATLSIGLEKLWNRSIMLGLFALFFLGGAPALLLQSLRARRQSRELEAPGRMLLTPVEIGQVGAVRGMAQVTYFDRVQQGKKAKQLTSEFPKGTGPMLLANRMGVVQGLGVRHEGASQVALLDEGLTRLDLTEAERSAMLAQISAEQASRGHVPGKKAKAGPKILRGILTFFGIILFFILAALGWWLWYVTNGSSQYDALGMEINNIMPAAVNEWGCGQLEARFGDQNAPFGCTAGDYVSWK